MSTVYGADFYSAIRASARASAEEVVPLLVDAVRPRSVVDIGCGDGTWLKVFEENGVSDFMGLDGSYVGPGSLQIPTERFMVRDLSQPFQIGIRYDLATCFEVAEHLPAIVADRFINELVGLAPVVAFSAAIPGQGGAGHVNEQWQDYWAGKFKALGYVAVDCIRPVTWGKDNVAAWYSQNLIVYVDQDRLEQYKPLLQRWQSTQDNPFRLVHPRIYLNALSQENWTVRQVLKLSAAVIVKALKWRMGNIRRKIYDSSR